jgi:hypothetical protein
LCPQKCPPSGDQVALAEDVLDGETNVRKGLPDGREVALHRREAVEISNRIVDCTADPKISSAILISANRSKYARTDALF